MEPVTLEDGELGLRPVSESDASAIYAACRDADMARFVPGFPDPYTDEDARRFVIMAVERWGLEEAYAFAVTRRSVGEFLGIIELRAPQEGVADVGYWIKVEARGRGIASSALRLISGWALRDLGVERLWLTTAPENVPSQRVAEKAGFTREGVLRAHVRFRDGRRDSVVFSLLPVDLV